MNIANISVLSAYNQIIDAPCAAIESARLELARRLGVSPDQIKLAALRAKTWNDTSLGCPEEGKCYLQVLTDGYALEFEVGDELYFVHVDMTGSIVVIPKYQ